MSQRLQAKRIADADEMTHRSGRHTHPYMQIELLMGGRLIGRPKVRKMPGSSLSGNVACVLGKRVPRFRQLPIHRSDAPAQWANTLTASLPRSSSMTTPSTTAAVRKGHSRDLKRRERRLADSPTKSVKRRTHPARGPVAASRRPQDPQIRNSSQSGQSSPEPSHAARFSLRVQSVAASPGRRTCVPGSRFPRLRSRLGDFLEEQRRSNRSRRDDRSRSQAT
jgi:hypothetical protein